MASREELLAEAQRRGLAGADMNAIRAEAIRRGLISEDQPTSVSIGQTLRGIPRAAGLVARDVIEGVGAVPALVTDIASVPINALLSAEDKLMGRQPGSRIPEQGAAFSNELTNRGFPVAATPTERIGGEAVKLVSGTGLVGTAAKIANEAKAVTGTGERVLSAMSENPGAQAVSAAGAGVAGESVREAGGGPWAQLVAALAGGIAAPAGLATAQRGVSALQSAARSALSPKEIEGQVQIAFERAGVDWRVLSDGARKQLVDDAKAAVYSGQQMDEAAMRRLADYRNIGATPLLGDVTQDPGILTRQRNLGKTQANMSASVGPNIAGIENQNAKTVLSTLDSTTSSPADAYTTGERLINKVKSVDQAIAAKEGQLYDTARGAAGQDIPLSRRGFVDDAFASLTKENKLAYLPAQVREMLNDISKGQITVNGQVHEVPFDVRTIDTLKTTLAAASRSAGKDGNARRAIALVRQALENTKPEAQLPTFGGTQAATAAQSAAIGQAGELPAQAMKLLDKARRLAKSRFAWQESAAFIEDALQGAQPDKFVQKHIINGSVSDLAKIRKLTGSDPTLREAVRGQLIAYIKQRGRADADVTRFSSKGMEDALKTLGDLKLRMWFKPEELTRIKSAIRVAKYMQSQPIGSAVNNSNSAATIIGKVMDSLIKGSKFIPLGEAVVGNPITNATVSLQARQLKNVGKGLTVPAKREPLPLSALLLGTAIPPSQDNQRQ